MITESTKTRLFIVGVVLFIAACLFLYFARGILAPFIIAGFITYLLSPFVFKIQSRGYRRWVAVVLIAAAFLVILGGVLLIIVPLVLDEIDKLKVNIPEYYRYISNHIFVWKTKLETAFPAIKNYHISDMVLEKAHSILVSEAQRIPSYIMNVFSLFSVIVLIPMLVFFMLLGGGRSIKSVVELVPSRAVETILSVIYEIDSVLGKFIRGQLIEASFVGVMSGAAMAAFGVNYAILIGIVAGIAHLIPYLGPVVGLSAALAVGLIQFHTAAIALKIVCAFAVILFLDS
ncbi:MAG: AI-2E family transporter, partial [Endomicrobia bacterium]|nr:AI-2E family transporter [Endomicrobiia bacterium]